MYDDNNCVLSWSIIEVNLSCHVNALMDCYIHWQILVCSTDSKQFSFHNIYKPFYVIYTDPL